MNEFNTDVENIRIRLLNGTTNPFRPIRESELLPWITCTNCNYVQEIYGSESHHWKTIFKHLIADALRFHMDPGHKCINLQSDEYLNIQ